MDRIDEHNDFSRFEQLAKQIDPGNRLLRIWSLTGGVSARTTAIEIAQAHGLTRRMVVRCHGDADLRRNRHVARDEFRVLRILQSARIPAPTPIYVEESGRIFSRPCLVEEFVDGESEFNPDDLDRFLDELAAKLAAIHAVDESRAELRFLPEREDDVSRLLAEQPDTLDHSMSEPEIRAALTGHWPPQRRNRPVLLHGDFWPGNVLWREGRIIAIVDWEDAARGDPLADLANSRLEILWAFGDDAMHRFTCAYSSLTVVDLGDLPIWDLWAALRPASQLSGWGLDEETEASMRSRHRTFVAQAIDSLSAR